MKISKTLPQFDTKVAILVVAAFQNGKLYLAKNGNVKEVKRVEFQTPCYSDREGFFGSQGKGNAMAFGSVREKSAVKSKVHKEFLKAIEEEVTKLLKGEKGANIYLFAPAHLLKTTRKNFSKTVQKRIMLTISGDYLDAHPFVLLEKIVK